MQSRKVEETVALGENERRQYQTTTVRESIFDLLRQHDLKAIFGNPGSTEIPMLQNYPMDFQYFMGLHEGTVISMAAGYALVTDRPAVVNLHTAVGVGNAMGAIVNAWHMHAPLIITAGQQDRRLLRSEPFLSGRLTELVQPYVKWSVEPHRAVDVPEAIERGFHISMSEPRGPVFISICMDGFDEVCPKIFSRKISYRTPPDPDAIQEIAHTLDLSKRIAIIAGEQIDAEGATPDVVKLAEKLNAGVYLPPLTYRWSFPSNHDLFRGRLPAAMRPIGEVLSPYDTVLVIGTNVFHYYPYVPGPIVREGTRVLQLTNDSNMASRAVIGDSVIGNVSLGVKELLRYIGSDEHLSPPPRPGTEQEIHASSPPKAEYVNQQLSIAFPPDVMIFDEAPSSSGDFVRQARVSEPKSYFLPASGSLGFAMPAAVGAALAQPGRPVVCIIGDGAAQFSIQSLWSAAKYDAPVTFIILNNGEYGILKSLTQLMNIQGLPDLNIPNINFEALSNGYGVEYRRVTEPDKLVGVVQEAISSLKPNVLEIPTDPEVGSLL